MRSLVVAGTALLVVALGVVFRPSAAGAVGGPVQSHVVLGYSVQGRPIVAYRLGDPKAGRTALLLGQMHGDEHAGVVLAQSLIHGRRAVEGLDLWVIPTMNPDGDHLHTRQNAHHVDLNRNWPDYWKHLSGEYYSGRRPLSEPETRIMRAFLLRVKPRYIISLHQPLDGVDTTDGGALDKGLVRRLTHGLGLPAKPFRCWSFCHGSMTGWYTTHHYGIAETIEFPAHPTRGYLTGRAPAAIVSALGGRFGPLARHDPRFAFTATAAKSAIDVRGWGFDPDVPATSIGYAAAVDDHVVARADADLPSADIDRHYGVGGRHRFDVRVRAKPGRHEVYVAFGNRGAGSSNPRRCVAVSVPA